MTQTFNYRPVTLLPARDKVFEKLLIQQVTAFIEPRLRRNLTAYRKSQSAETSSIKYTENWKRAIDDSNVVRIVVVSKSYLINRFLSPLLNEKIQVH